MSWLQSIIGDITNDVPGAKSVNNWASTSRLGDVLTGGVARAANRDDWRMPGRRSGNEQTSWDDLAAVGTGDSSLYRNTARGVGAGFGLWGLGELGGLGSEEGSISPTQYAATDSGTMTDAGASGSGDLANINWNSPHIGDQALSGSDLQSPMTSMDESSMMQQMRDQELGSSYGEDQSPSRFGNGSLLSQLFSSYPKSTMGVLGGLALLNTIASYRQSKARQQANQAAQQAQQNRINQQNVNPVTGGANPSPTMTAYTGTPNYNPFIPQSPTDRLAFGPANWQVHQAEGGPAGDGPIGGLTLAQGPGGGQDDTIPARLSDGEYVFSAQDVSDIGDGSTQAGARKLDEMRELIRQKAGRKEVKKIAPKQPDASAYASEVMS